MGEFDITPIVKAVVVLIATLVTTFLVPYLKSKYTKSQLDYAIEWVKIAVQAAEMIFPEEKQGELKKKYVIDFLSEHNMHFDEKVVNNLIESAVLELNEQLYAA